MATTSTTRVNSSREISIRGWGSLATFSVHWTSSRTPMRSNGEMGQDSHAEPQDGAELAELRETARRLQRQTPHELCSRVRLGRMRGRGRVLPESLLEARRSIIVLTREQLRGHGMPAPMLALLFVYLDDITAYAEVAPYVPPLDFPTAVHVTACGRALPGPVGAALLCYYIGLHMLDDVHDDELPAGVDANEASLVALTCVATLPALILMGGQGAGWQAPRDVRQRLSVELHCRAHPTMTGQFLDISRSIDCDLARAYEVISQRNGAIGQVFGRIAAIAAGCAEPEIDALGLAVANMSMASQVLDDIENLWNRPVSSDAINRAKTLPLCFVLETRADLREDILALCDDPRPPSHQRLREQLARHGGLHFSLVSIALFRSRARRALLSVGARAELGALEEYLLEVAAPAVLTDAQTGGGSGTWLERGRGAALGASDLLEAALQLGHGR